MNFKTWCFGVLVLNVGFVGLLFAQTPTPAPLTIDQTSNSIRVDGHLEDWPSARMFLLNQKSQIVQGKSVWQGEDDFSGRVFFTYNDQYLFVVAVVQKKGKRSSITIQRFPFLTGIVWRSSFRPTLNNINPF